VAQFEKLWGDMTALPDTNCGFLHVSRLRGQQLKIKRNSMVGCVMGVLTMSNSIVIGNNDE
jgi:hypothetical protein